MSELTLPALRGMFAGETDEAFLVCLTIEHEDLAAPIRLVNDTVDLTRSAGEFIAWPFEVALPDDVEAQLPRVQLVIDNVDRAIVAAIRPLQGRVTLTLEVVLASSPNEVEAGPYALTLKDVSYDRLTVSGTLGYEDVLNAPYPKDSFTPLNSTGLF